MESIKKQNQDLKSDLVDGLNQLGKERDEETKLIILSLKKRIVMFLYELMRKKIIKKE